MDQERQEKKRAYRVAKQIVHEGIWLQTATIDFVNEQGKEIKSWEMIQRTKTIQTNEKQRVDSVDLIPIIKYKNGQKKLLLIANYRPPVDGYVIEFPAGLLDTQDIKENARRELLEETGYTADTIQEFNFSPIVYPDPWKSNETSKMVIAYIDGDLECNKNPVQNLENEENIDVLLFDLNESLMNQIQSSIQKNSYFLEQKMYTFLIGMLWISI